MLSTGRNARIIRRILDHAKDSSTREQQFTGFSKYSPLPSQHKFHATRKRYKGFSGPIGSGKSLALSHEAIRLGYANVGRWGLIGAPTYPMLRDSTQRAVIEVLIAEGIRFEQNKADNWIELQDCKSRILFRSLDAYERLRGTNLAWFGVDELTYVNASAWDRLEGRLRDPHATELCGFAAWTARGFDWVYDKFIARPGEDTVAIIAQPFENKALATYYETLKSSYSEPFYRQEVLGEYLNIFTGRAYYAFDRGGHCKPVALDPDLELCWSLDFNVTPMSSVICQIERRVIPASYERLYGTRTDERTQKSVRVLDEIVLNDSNVGEVCKEFHARARRLTKRRPIYVGVYGDATGSARQHSGLTNWRLVEDYFRGDPDFRLDMRIRSSNPQQRDRVNAVNAKLRGFDGTIGVTVDPKCSALIRDLEQVGWKLDAHGSVTANLDQSKGLTHISDALGYLIWAECPVTAKHGFSGEVIV